MPRPSERCRCIPTRDLVAAAMAGEPKPQCPEHDPDTPAQRETTDHQPAAVALNDGPGLARIIGAELHTTPTADLLRSAIHHQTTTPTTPEES